MKTAPDIDLEGLDLLVVEDDETSALLISRVLAKHGARTVTAVDGCDGLRKFQEKRFPIVITDINMPGMSGLDLVSGIKALEPDTLVIATSANRDTECLVSAIELGFNDYLLKPIVVEKLLLAVKQCSEISDVRRRFKDEQGKFKVVVECLGEGIAIKDLDYRIVYQNRAMTAMFGDRTGTPCYGIFDLDRPCQDCPTALALKDGRTHSANRVFRRGEETLHIESIASLIRDSQGTVTGTVEIIRDVSERIRNENTIRELAFHDPLTGLPNRRLFEDRLGQAIAQSHRYGMKFGLMFLDLDHFKVINDTLGHDAGDLLLIEAGERIRSCCKRDLDTISRHGGDEFCVIIVDCEKREQLTAIAENLLQQFARPFLLQATEVRVTASIGISIFPDNGSVMKELEIAADRAMYAAKKAGRNTYCFWEPFYGTSDPLD